MKIFDKKKPQILFRKCLFTFEEVLVFSAYIPHPHQQLPRGNQALPWSSMFRGTWSD